MNGWDWCYDGYDPAAEKLREALCTVGNGYLASRGAAPESVADGVHYPGTYAAGVYNRLSAPVAGAVVDNESLVNLPNWLPVSVRANGGPVLSADTCEVLEYRQCLDLRRGVLTRRLLLRDPAGRTTALVERRLAHMRLPHVCALEVTVAPQDWSGRLEVRSLLDGRVSNALVERYRDLGGDHLTDVHGRAVSPDTVLLQARTSRSGIDVAMAARSVLWRGEERADAGRRLLLDAGTVGSELTVDVAPGDAVTLEKVVTTYTGRDPAVEEPAEAATRWLGRLGRFEELLESHVLAWSHLWERFSVQLEGGDADGDGDTSAAGDEQVQRILRLHQLHLLQTVSPHSAGLDVGVPARGLSGEAYRGHIFWDELFVFPVLNLRLPALTRSLLGYRYRRLPEARHAAAEAGFAGAMYPWQSGSDGREESQRLHLNPRSGRWLPDPTRLQRHIGIAVAYNVWQYLQATGDEEFLADYGAEMLVEIARFWASAAEYDPARGRHVIRRVMGPDEFHSGYPGAGEDGVDNNAYTNVMAVWVLLRALEALDLLPQRARRQLTETLGLRAQELARWDDISRSMLVPFHADGVLSQFEGYADLAELDWDGYRRRYGNIQRLDRILEAEGDDVNRYQVSKQADVLMLFYLLSADELGELLDRLGYPLQPDTIPRTLDYYLARTSHGSTLSAVVHAWVLARSHRERAAEFFGQALRADVADVQGGTTAEGIHLAAMAGSVDLLQRCFSGLETRAGRLLLNPYWPRSLGVLEVALRYREHPLLVRIRGPEVEVAADPGRQRPVFVECRGQRAELHPGSTVRFPL